MKLLNLLKLHKESYKKRRVITKSCKAKIMVRKIMKIQKLCNVNYFKDTEDVLFKEGKGDIKLKESKEETR